MRLAQTLMRLSHGLNLILVGAPVIFFWYVLSVPITKQAVFTGLILHYAAVTLLVCLGSVLLNLIATTIAYKKKLLGRSKMLGWFAGAILLALVCFVMANRYIDQQLA